MGFPAVRNSDHVVVAISIDFPINLKWNASFHRIAYDYSCADWDCLCDHLRDVPWENIVKFSASAASSKCLSGFWLELMYISLVVGIR